jgi:hypothetical protein
MISTTCRCFTGGEKVHFQPFFKNNLFFLLVKSRFFKKDDFSVIFPPLYKGFVSVLSNVDTSPRTEN